MTPGMMAFGRARSDTQRRRVVASAPLPGTYRLTAPNGEVVHGELRFGEGCRGAQLRVWCIAGAEFGDGHLSDWKIGSRIAGPGLLPKEGE